MWSIITGSLAMTEESTVSLKAAHHIWSTSRGAFIFFQTVMEANWECVPGKDIWWRPGWRDNMNFGLSQSEHRTNTMFSCCLPHLPPFDFLSMKIKVQNDTLEQIQQQQQIHWKLFNSIWSMKSQQRSHHSVLYCNVKILQLITPPCILYCILTWRNITQFVPWSYFFVCCWVQW